MVTGVKIQTKDVSFDDTMETLSDKRVRQQETIAISTAFLEVIGLLECSTTRRRLSQCCLCRLQEMFEAFGPVADKFSEDESEILANSLILFHVLKMGHNAGIPGPLLEHSAKLLSATMRYIIRTDCAEQVESA